MAELPGRPSGRPFAFRQPIGTSADGAVPDSASAGHAVTSLACCVSTGRGQSTGDASGRQVAPFLGGSTMQRLLSVVAVTALVAGCATSPKDIAPAYVSPVLSCEHLAAEAQRVSAAAQAASGQQQSQANKDAAMVTVGVILFWPSLFFVGGDKGSAAELARLKGEMQAIEQANIAKSCGLQFRAG